jgi:hypothetical protein
VCHRLPIAGTAFPEITPTNLKLDLVKLEPCLESATEQVTILSTKAEFLKADGMRMRHDSRAYRRRDHLGPRSHAFHLGAAA